MIKKEFWTKTKNLFVSIFNKTNINKKEKINLSCFPIGKTVEITLISSLKEIGISDPNGRMSLRFDEEDYQTKKITGVVTGTRTVSDVQTVEIDSIKIKNGLKTFRHYTIMLEEIKNVKVLS